MVKYYIDITLLPSSDVGLYFLWEKIFGQLHLDLTNMLDPDGVGNIGISLPDYNAEKNQIGSRLRLLSYDSTTLEELNISNGLKCFADYVHITGIRDVPSKIKTYARYKRQQPKSSNARLARRKAKRGGIEYADALRLISSHTEEQVRTPYINMNSQSTGRRFRLFIVQEIMEKSIDEGFSSYGLSSISTVPVF